MQGGDLPPAELLDEVEAGAVEQLVRAVRAEEARVDALVGQRRRRGDGRDLNATQGRKEMCYLTTHSTHFIYGYMASDIWLRTILIVKKETRCRHMGYSFLLAAMVLLYAPSHKQDSTYHGLCYTSCGALAGTRNSSIGPPWRINPTIYHSMSERSYHITFKTPENEWMKYQVNDWTKSGWMNY